MAKIVIDPGHGGPDPGAVGPSGVQEKVVVLAVAKLLADILSAAGVEVRLTRDSDDVPWIPSTDLSERVRISNYAGADLFISIHANAFSSPQAKGMEIWTSVGQTRADILAESIADALIEAFPDLVFRADMSDGDKDKEENWYVCRWTNAPAVLIELAFITNPEEEAMLKDPAHQKKVAWAIAKGIAAYAGFSLVEPVDPVAEAITTLQEAGIIDSPQYWLENARPSKTVEGVNAGYLLQKMAKKLKEM